MIDWMTSLALPAWPIAPQTPVQPPEFAIPYQELPEFGGNR